MSVSIHSRKGDYPRKGGVSLRPLEHPGLSPHGGVSFDLLKLSGLSPRVRGTDYNSSQQFRATRLIPACAGNIPQISMAASVRMAHPRVCGEHSLSYLFRERM